MLDLFFANVPLADDMSVKIDCAIQADQRLRSRCDAFDVSDLLWGSQAPACVSGGLRQDARFYETKCLGQQPEAAFTKRTRLLSVESVRQLTVLDWTDDVPTQKRVEGDGMSDQVREGRRLGGENGREETDFWFWGRILVIFGRGYPRQVL